jgi:tetratricopeptide (TPR) repeat protein
MSDITSKGSVMGRITTAMVFFMICGSYVALPQGKQLVPTGSGGRKIALVIGNSSYEESPLKNVVNDAVDMRKALRDKGFEVSKCCDNVDYPGLKSAIDKWTESLQKNDIAVFYFSGHGIRVKSVDYLLPIDYPSKSTQATAERYAYAVDDVQEKMQERGTKVNLIILDACRNNPYVFGKSYGTGLGGTLAADGTFIIYAASPGQVADVNAEGKNSLFTLALLEELRLPSVSLRTLGNYVKDRVWEMSGKTQRPYIAENVVGDVVLGAGSYSAEGHMIFGLALSSTGDWDGAMAQWSEALRLKPDYAEVHEYLGFGLSRKGDWDGAIAQYLEALRLKPDYAEAHSNLGIALGVKGLTDDGIAEEREALRLNPDLAEAHEALGSRLGDKGDWDGAIREERVAIRLKPDLAEAHGILGFALRGKGDHADWDEAIRENREAIRLKPDYEVAHANLGASLADKGDWDGEIREEREAIRLKPDLAEAHECLGVALEHKGDTQSALAEYRRALELKPGFAEAQRCYDKLLKQTNNSPK